MSRFIEIEEQISNKGWRVTPKSYWKSVSEFKGIRPEPNRRLVFRRISIVNIDEIKCILPSNFSCDTDDSPIYPIEYTIYLNGNTELIISVEEYEKKIKPVLFEKKLEAAL